MATPAEAFELSGGIGFGGVLAGTVPRLAVSPHAVMSWPTSNGFLFAAHEMISILMPTSRGGPGVYEQTSAVIGYASEKQDFSLGPSLSLYYMPACGAKICGRVGGLAAGGHAQVNAYVFGRLGVSVNASLDWISGRSGVLPGSLAATIVAGPVLRWSQEKTP